MHPLLHRFSGLFIFFFTAATSFSQSGSFWDHPDFTRRIVRFSINDKQRDHLSVRPYPVNNVSATLDSSESLNLILPKFGKAFWDTPEKGDFSFSFIPYLDAFAGYSSERNFIHRIMPGFAARTTYGKKWSLYFEFFGGEERQPAYLNAFTDSTGVLPSIGPDLANNGNRAVFLPTARLAFAPSDYFEFELGFGKNFFGNGYRSLFLSDVAYNYPFFKITTDVWNIKYINLFSLLSGNQNGSEIFPAIDKYSASHFLSWAVSPKFNIGLFETIIWQRSDSLSNRGFDPNYLNPVIFYRPVEFSQGSPDNALIGVDLSFKVTKNVLLYGQVLFDEFLLSEFRARNGWWGNKWGAQLGIRSFNSFGFENLDLQAEFNLARPFTYTHGSVLQNFGHFSQPLAHILGTNFYEGLLRGYYEKENYFAEAEFLFAVYGRDSDSLNLGGDIFRSYVNPATIYGNEVAQGQKQNLYFQRLSAGIILNRSMNLRASLSYTLRYLNQEEGTNQDEHILGLTISTAIRKDYRDF